MKKKVYVGKSVKTRKLEILRSDTVPTESSHGDKFSYVIGPFRTLGAATLMANYGAGNPHLQHVSDAERIAKKRRSTPHHSR